jgi:hypothetical protein
MTVTRCRRRHPLACGNGSWPPGVRVAALHVFEAEQQPPPGLDLPQKPGAYCLTCALIAASLRSHRVSGPSVRAPLTNTCPPEVCRVEAMSECSPIAAGSGTAGIDDRVGLCVVGLVCGPLDGVEGVFAVQAFEGGLPGF